VFDPATSVFSIVDISATISGTNKYCGGVLAPNGKIYFAPMGANHVGVFDPATSAFSVIDISATITGDWKYFGAVLAPNGKIYFVPGDAFGVGVFDPATHAFSVVDISSTDYFGGVLAPNGKIYFAPRNALNVGVFDPATNAFSVVDFSDSISGFSGTNKYAGGVLAPNGNIYFAPCHADHVRALSPSLPSSLSLARSLFLSHTRTLSQVGMVDPGNSAPAYTVSGGVPQVPPPPPGTFVSCQGWVDISLPQADEGCEPTALRGARCTCTFLGSLRLVPALRAHATCERHELITSPRSRDAEVDQELKRTSWKLTDGSPPLRRSGRGSSRPTSTSFELCTLALQRAARLGAFQQV